MNGKYQNKNQFSISKVHSNLENRIFILSKECEEWQWKYNSIFIEKQRLEECLNETYEEFEFLNKTIESLSQEIFDFELKEKNFTKKISKLETEIDFMKTSQNPDFYDEAFQNLNSKYQQALKEIEAYEIKSYNYEIHKETMKEILFKQFFDERLLNSEKEISKLYEYFHKTNSTIEEFQCDILKIKHSLELKNQRIKLLDSKLSKSNKEKNDIKDYFSNLLMLITNQVKSGKEIFQVNLQEIKEIFTNQQNFIKFLQSFNTSETFSKSTSFSMDFEKIEKILHLSQIANLKFQSSVLLNESKVEKALLSFENLKDAFKKKLKKYRRALVKSKENIQILSNSLSLETLKRKEAELAISPIKKKLNIEKDSKLSLEFTLKAKELENITLKTQLRVVQGRNSPSEDQRGLNHTFQQNNEDMQPTSYRKQGIQRILARPKKKENPMKINSSLRNSVDEFPKKRSLSRLNVNLKSAVKYNVFPLFHLQDENLAASERFHTEN